MNSHNRKPDQPYNFTANDPYDRSQPIELVVQRQMSSPEFMSSIRQLQVRRGALAIWYLGQNGFLLKEDNETLIGIDLYLTNSCGEDFRDLPFRTDRQLPIFIEPEDLDLDFFITTHSHQDHADGATINRAPKGKTKFVGPFDSCQVYRQGGVAESDILLVHPGESCKIGTVTLKSTFALPTDQTDLNHSGALLTFSTGITFYNTGDTAWAEILPSLLPSHVDVCAICINGGYHNLAPEQAAAIVKSIEPRFVVPCHYDMMVNNVGSPLMFKAALDRGGSTAAFHIMRYYEPWIYTRN